MLTDHLRVGQVEVVHDADEVLQRLGQSRIERLLLGHGGDGPAVVVVSRIQSVMPWQREDHLLNGVVEGLGGSTLRTVARRTHFI